MHYGGVLKIRRWVKFTPKQLHQRKVDGIRERYLSKNKRTASKLWKSYMQEDGKTFDFGKFIVEDMEFSDKYDAGVLVWFWKCECVPSGFKEGNFYLGLAQLNSSTSISSAKKQVKKEIQRLKTDPKYMTEFFNWCFNYVSNYKDAFKIVPPTDYSMRIDDADGVAYNRTAFDFYEAEAEAKWKSS